MRCILPLRCFWPSFAASNQCPDTESHHHHHLHLRYLDHVGEFKLDPYRHPNLHLRAVSLFSRMGLGLKPSAQPRIVLYIIHNSVISTSKSTYSHSLRTHLKRRLYQWYITTSAYTDCNNNNNEKPQSLHNIVHIVLRINITLKLSPRQW